MTSATDNRTTELREKLTERGVEWTGSRYSGARHAEHTKWTTASGHRAKYTEYHDGQTVLAVDAQNLTPEQAVAATLGSVEYEGFFYLPKPKKNIVQYGEVRIEKTENGYKMQQPVEVVESAARAWGNELGEHIMMRICEVWNARAERTCRIVEYADAPFPVCSECGAVQPDDFTVYYCWNCGAKVIEEVDNADE